MMLLFPRASLSFLRLGKYRKGREEGTWEGGGEADHIYVFFYEKGRNKFLVNDTFVMCADNLGKP